MFVLLVGLTVKAGQEQALEKDYSGLFTAAISMQEGFRHLSLLRPNDSSTYVLTIAFEDQRFQQRWVASDLHGQVWPVLAGHLVEFTVKTYTTV